MTTFIVRIMTIRYLFWLVNLLLVLVLSQNSSVSLEYFCARAGHSSE
jgi:hypothetical protein